jgi:hypothetical protein
MTRLFMATLTAVAAPWLAGADAMPTRLQGPAPEVVLAQALEKEGAWVVRVSVPETRSDGLVVPVEETRWFDCDLVVDGSKVRALGTDGKAIDVKELPKRLAKPTRVVLFRGAGEPDLSHLAVFPEFVVVLVAPADSFKAPAEKK